MTITSVSESDKVQACLSDLAQAISTQDIHPIIYKYGVKHWPMPNWRSGCAYGVAYDRLCEAMQALFYDGQGFVLCEPRKAFQAETGIELLYIGTTYRDRTLDEGIRFLYQDALIYVRSPIHSRPC